MKKIYLASTLLALLLPALLPSLAFPQEKTAEDFSWEMGEVKKRITALEKDVTEIKKQLSAWDQGVPKPSTSGHEIRRGLEAGEEVLSNDEIVALYIKNEAEISKIWKSLPEEKTMRDAVLRWKAMKAGTICDCILSGKCDCDGNCKCPRCPVHRCVSPDVMKDLYKDDDKPRVTPSGLENQDEDRLQIYGVSWKGTSPTNKGRELLYFGASWCENCPPAIKRLGSLTSDIYYIDCSEEGGKGDTLAAMYQVDSYPTLIAIDDGVKAEGLHTEGNSVGSFLAAKWLGKTAPESSVGSKTLSETESLRYHMRMEHGYSPSKLSEMSDSEVKAAHDSLHEKSPSQSAPPRIVYRSAPAAPRMTYAAPPSYSSGKNVVRYGGSTWTWPGNLRQHLESVHRISTAGLSDSQLRTVHDNMHNTGRSGITGGSSGGYSSGGYTYSSPPRAPAYTRRSYAPTSYFTPSYSYGSSCPGGNCPR